MLHKRFSENLACGSSFPNQELQRTLSSFRSHNREIARLSGIILILSSILLNVIFTYDLKKNLSTNLKLLRCVHYTCSLFYIPWLNTLISLAGKYKLSTPGYCLSSDLNILLRILSPNILIKFYVAAIQFHIYGKIFLISFQVTVL